MTSEDAVPKRPGWLVLFTWGAFLCTVPSALWRVAMIMGWLPDTSELRARELGSNTVDGYLYVYALSIVQVSFGFLTVGLVRPWGERIRGWTIPRIIPTLLGILGGLAVTWIFNIAMVSAIAFGRRPDGGTMSGWPLVVMVWCYLPLLLWGPLAVLSACGYWWVRRPPRTTASRAARAEPEDPED